MRIVIDLQSCQSESRFRGIGRYSMSLAKAMVRHAGNHEIWIALNESFQEAIPSIRSEFDGLIPMEHIATFSVPGPVLEEKSQNSWRARAAELLREYFLAGLEPDVVHVTSMFEGYKQDVVSSIGVLNNNLPTAVTLYDLIPYINQETYLPNQQIKDHYMRKIDSLKKASRLLAISEYSRQEAISALGFSEASIFNISAAIEDVFKPREISQDEKYELFDRFNITRPFIMCSPGGFDERKNITGLVTAFSKLPLEIRKKYQLVVTGKIHEEPCAKIIRHARGMGLREDEFIFTDFVDNDELISFYNLCELFVFPSYFEGFGLPVLEAMACNAVVIASNTTSFPEIIGRTDALFDPANPGKMAELIQKALTDQGFRRELKEHGIRQTEKFSWDHSAQKVISVFEQLYDVTQAEKAGRMFGYEGAYKNVLSSIAAINAPVVSTKLDLVNVAKSIVLNSPVSDPKQMLVDISVLVHGDAKSGIQRVVRSILLELFNSPPDGYLVKPIYFDDQRYRYANRFIANFLSTPGDIPDDDVIDVARGDIYLGLDLSAHITMSIHDYLKHLNYMGVKLFFIVYDVLPALHPEWWPWGTGEIFVQWLRSITQIATGLACISHAVADELKDWLDSNPADRFEPLQIGYFHLGADIENSAPTTGIPKDAAGILKKLESTPSFLMVGTIEPRKGHTQTLDAFEILWNQGLDINLVIVGKRGWLVDTLVERLSNHSMLGKCLFWLEGISDAYLEKIYAASDAVIMASEGEGFGLPIIEAARHNVPLILRDLPVFREIAFENATYFNGLRPYALSNTIFDWLEQDKLGKTPDSRNIRFLTWNESAQSLIDLLQNPRDLRWVGTWQKTTKVINQ